MTIFLAILAAVASNTVLGMLWYGPLFGKPWMKLMKMTPEDTKNAGPAMGMATGIGAIGLAAMVMMLNRGMSMDIIADRGEAAQFGALFGLLLAIIVAAVQFNPVAYGKDDEFGNRLRLWVIHIGYTFISTILAAVFASLVLFR